MEGRQTHKDSPKGKRWWRHRDRDRGRQRQTLRTPGTVRGSQQTRFEPKPCSKGHITVTFFQVVLMMMMIYCQYNTHRNSETGCGQGGCTHLPSSSPWTPVGVWFNVGSPIFRNLFASHILHDLMSTFMTPYEVMTYSLRICALQEVSLLPHQSWSLESVSLNTVTLQSQGCGSLGIVALWEEAPYRRTSLPGDKVYANEEGELSVGHELGTVKIQQGLLQETPGAVDGSDLKSRLWPWHLSDRVVVVKEACFSRCFLRSGCWKKLYPQEIRTRSVLQEDKKCAPGT